MNRNIPLHTQKQDQTPGSLDHMLRTRQFSKMYENWRISTGDRLWRSLLGESSSFSPAKWNKIVFLWGIPTVMALYQLKVSSNHIYGMLTPFMGIYNWQRAIWCVRHTQTPPFPPASHGDKRHLFGGRETALTEIIVTAPPRIEVGIWRDTIWRFIKQNIYI